MMMAAGCTSTSGTTPATPAAEEMSSWSGIWSTTFTSADYATLMPGDDITFTQTGKSVTGTYTNPE
ncbi:MAG: hypothetical protein JXQ82_02695 [Methanomicrobiaceae archaeon]|nr:hypothetical protein [Methanomicrobiaceae archaeon]